MDTLRELVLEVYDRIIGLELADVGGRGWLHHQSPLRWGEGGQESPVDRRKQGIKRSTAVDARGIPIGTLTAPAHGPGQSSHDSPLLTPTLDAVTETLGELYPKG